MTGRRRRAFAMAVVAILLALVCAVLSTNVDGGQRAALLAVTVGWLLVGASYVVSGLRTKPPVAADEPFFKDEPAGDDAT